MFDSESLLSCEHAGRRGFIPRHRGAGQPVSAVENAADFRPGKCHRISPWETPPVFALGNAAGFHCGKRRRFPSWKTLSVSTVGNTAVFLRTAPAAGLYAGLLRISGAGGRMYISVHLHVHICMYRKDACLHL